MIAALRRIDGSNITIDLVSVDTKTGSEQWRVPLPGRPDFTEEVVVSGDLVLVPETRRPRRGVRRDNRRVQVAVRSAGTVAPPRDPDRRGRSGLDLLEHRPGLRAQRRDGTVLAQSSGLGSDIGNVFAPWGQRVRSVGGVSIAPIGAFVAAFDPPEAPS